MGQTFTCLYSHLIIATHRRVEAIKADIRPRLYKYMSDILAGEKCVLLAAGGTSDHVHLLLSIRPNISLSEAARAIKGKTSKWMQVTFPDLASFEWQSGFSAFSVSHSNLEKVREFILKQDEHHKRASFRDELIAILKKHDMEFDSKYIM